VKYEAMASHLCRAHPGFGDFPILMWLPVPHWPQSRFSSVAQKTHHLRRERKKGDL